MNKKYNYKIEDLIKLFDCTYASLCRTDEDYEDNIFVHGEYYVLGMKCDYSKIITLRYYYEDIKKEEAIELVKEYNVLLTLFNKLIEDLPQEQSISCDNKELPRVMYNFNEGYNPSLGDLDETIQDIIKILEIINIITELKSIQIIECIEEDNNEEYNFQILFQNKVFEIKFATYGMYIPHKNDFRNHRILMRLLKTKNIELRIKKILKKRSYDNFKKRYL